MYKPLFAIASLLALSLPAQAVTIAQWTFELSTTPADATDAALYPNPIAPSLGSGVAAGRHASALTDWSSPAGNGSTDSFSSNTWAVNDYYQFSTSTTGYQGITLAWDQTSSNTGPRDFKLAYSTNGSTFTDFANYTVLANAAPNPTWSALTPQAIYGLSFNLSTVTALDNQASVFFRLLDTSTASANGGTVAAGGTSRVDNFTISAISAVPEPGTYAMLLAGLAAVGFVARRRA